jgi:hypothetical protein
MDDAKDDHIATPDDGKPALSKTWKTVRQHRGSYTGGKVTNFS